MDHLVYCHIQACLHRLPIWHCAVEDAVFLFSLWQNVLLRIKDHQEVVSDKRAQARRESPNTGCASDSKREEQRCFKKRIHRVLPVNKCKIYSVE